MAKKITKKTQNILNKPMSTASLALFFILCLGLIAAVFIVSNKASMDTRSNAETYSVNTGDSGRTACQMRCYRVLRDDPASRRQCYQECANPITNIKPNR